jgi:CRP/FNR family transcriptional regulator
MPQERAGSDVLEPIPYFAVLDARERAQVARTVRRRRLSAGQQILAQGEPCEGLLFVIEGQVRLVRASADGREQVMAVLGPGATFNDAAVFDGGPNADSAVAVGPALVGLVPKGSMTALIENNPLVARAGLKVLAARQRSLAGVVEDLALRDVAARIARLLLGCVGQHGHIIEKADTACLRITHQEIATMVGSVREVVQRALKELERDGAVALERTRVRVRDVAKLNQWAQG